MPRPLRCHTDDIHVDEIITCIDCGGRAHLLTTWPEDDPPQPGDVMAYRCEECLDRWDLVLAEDDP